MGDTLTSLIAIFIAAILMFIFPLMTITERNDDIVQLAVQTATVEFVDDIRTTGKITESRWDEFMNKLVATQNGYDVQMEVKILDENPSKKTTIGNPEIIGENAYYSIYNKQILDTFGEVSGGEFILKEGDIVSVVVKNTNITISQLLRNFFYTVTGNNTAQISGQHAGMVMSNGSNK